MLKERSLPKKFNLATAYAGGIENNKVIKTVPIDTYELVRIYLPKSYVLKNDKIRFGISQNIFEKSILKSIGLINKKAVMP